MTSQQRDVEIHVHETLLMSARSILGNFKVTVFYVIISLKLNVIFQVDRTPLHMAAQHGHKQVVDLLISSGACANNTDMVS